ncbi:hypothetical protein Ais01nite_26190 [Asanoa ishikariensis]|uniref:DUF2867 domain-containing protein n=1 Tax=Asanoa ishikariensis TaxID=137265 RepID=A0A1H3QYY5_9ACTN|nr:hypothetical protein [Asanoa ishikariensis]GIF64584.1 hypothetical protein Ais01nite_26190 [Asanoa ishikariensis]SDZ18453.1 hypothetical protein SAMN05421684_3301 [Asanoa ishikariensis]
MTVVRTHDIPAPARALSSLDTIDYADHFTLATDAEATAEQWARAMFGNVPSPGEILIWRFILGLRLHQGRSPNTVAGWHIGARGDDWIRLEAQSWFLSGNLVVHAMAGRVSLWTFLHYDGPVGQHAWPPLSTIHRGLVPGVLRKAAARIRRRPR